MKVIGEFTIILIALVWRGISGYWPTWLPNKYLSEAGLKRSFKQTNPRRNR